MDRRLVIGALLAVSVATTGCVQAVAGGTMSYEASPANVDGQTLSETQYKLNERDQVSLSHQASVPVVGQREVNLTSHLRSYHRAEAESGNASETAVGAFFLMSTPKAVVLGKQVNPLGRVSLKQLVGRIASGQGTYGDLERVGGRNLTVLESSTTVAKYETAVEAKGQSVGTFVYVTRVLHDGDYVIVVALLPEVFSEEEPDLYAMMGNVSHGKN
jgi:hypothetical protein